MKRNFIRLVKQVIILVFVGLWLITVYQLLSQTKSGRKLANVLKKYNKHNKEVMTTFRSRKSGIQVVTEAPDKGHIKNKPEENVRKRLIKRGPKRKPAVPKKRKKFPDEYSLERRVIKPQNVARRRPPRQRVINKSKKVKSDRKINVKIKHKEGIKVTQKAYKKESVKLRKVQQKSNENPEEEGDEEHQEEEADQEGKDKDDENVEDADEKEADGDGNIEDGEGNNDVQKEEGGENEGEEDEDEPDDDEEEADDFEEEENDVITEEGMEGIVIKVQDMDEKRVHKRKNEFGVGVIKDEDFSEELLAVNTDQFEQVIFG